MCLSHFDSILFKHESNSFYNVESLLLTLSYKHFIKIQPFTQVTKIEVLFKMYTISQWSSVHVITTYVYKKKSQ